MTLFTVLFGDNVQKLFRGKENLRLLHAKQPVYLILVQQVFAKLMKDCSVTPGKNAMKAFSKRDVSRLRNATIKISRKYKDCRRQLRSKQKHVCQKAKESCISGAFGITPTPEYKKNFSSRKKKQSRIEEARKTETLRRRELIHVEAADNHCNIEPRIQFVLPQTDKFTVFYK